MQVVQTLETVKIETNNSHLFQQARSLIRKNLRKSIGKKAKLISFCDENELVQRRYLFKWLNCLNRKINHEDLQLERSFYKALHLHLRQSGCLKSIINAEIFFEQDLIQIKFSHLDELLAAYLKNYFKSHTCEVIKDSFIITYQNDNTLELLNTLASSNEHLNRYISFSLCERQMLQFKQRLAQKHKSSGRFLALCSLYEEQFRTLNLDLGASEQEYKSRYRELARKYHPDYHAGASEQVKALCAQRFAAINQAYLILKPLYAEHG